MKTRKILLHGLGQTSADWEKTTERLTDKTGIYCPDLPALLRGRKISYENLYASFADNCDTFSESLDLCGLSLGGILALQYAIERPEKVHSLVLIATQYTMPKALLAFQNTVFRFMPDSMFRQMGFGKKDFIALSKSMMHLDFSQRLDKVSCPVCVICGEKDSANRKASEELAKQLCCAELQIIEHAGHEVNIDAPEQLADVLNCFYNHVY